MRFERLNAERRAPEPRRSGMRDAEALTQVRVRTAGMGAQLNTLVD
jgi:hypothetical protein